MNDAPPQQPPVGLTVPWPLAIAAAVTGLLLVLGQALPAFQGAGYGMSLATIGAYVVQTSDDLSGAESLVVLAIALASVIFSLVVLAALGSLIAYVARRSRLVLRLGTTVTVLLALAAVITTTLALLLQASDQAEVGPGPWVYLAGVVGLVVCRVMAGRPARSGD